MTLVEITEAIAALSLDEARALVDALRARLALEAPVDQEALRWASQGAVYGAPPFAPLEPEQVVVLEACGPERVRVLAALRSALALSPQEAKSLLERAPVALGPFADRRSADDLAGALLAAGAAVRLRAAT